MRAIKFGIGLIIALASYATGQSVVAAQNGQIASSARNVTFAFNNTPLSAVLDELAQKSGTKITYSGDVVSNKRVSALGTNVGLKSALAQILAGTRLTVVVEGNQMVIVPALVRKSSVSAQGIIAGKVTDAKSGRGISGANVSINSGTNVTTIEDGSYRINGIAAGIHTVSVRLLGYAKQTRIVTVGDGATITIDFRLEASVSVLNEVVVTGTVASTELKAVPNAITIVTAKQIEERGITRIDQLFRGEIPGLFSLEQGAGSPNAIASLDEVLMFSRGTTKISTTSAAASSITNPIKTYVDGVELADAQYLSQIDPKSIERIEILTGPQASTIYGANAINGVMQIFTKRGSTVMPSITFNISEGFAQNNFSSAFASSHQYDGNISGAEGKVSYNAGSSWNYTGAWSPGKRIQRTSVYGGSRYQSGMFSLDVSARQGWTRNKQSGEIFQALTALAENGRFTYASVTGGITAPARLSLSGKTFGLTFGFAPLSWWSHQLSVGSDVSDFESLELAAGFANRTDTSMFNSQFPNTRVSQSYSSTLRIPIFSAVQATVTYGGDHWRSRSSFVQWNIEQSGRLTSPFASRPEMTTAKNSGAYVQGQFGLWDALFLTYGIRTDWAPVYGEKAKVRPGRYGVSYSKEFGIVSAKLRGSYGRSITPPAAGQIEGDQVLPTSSSEISDLEAFVAGSTDLLYRNLPSPALGPAFQQGGEGGIELYLGSRGSLLVTRYNQTVDGLIALVNNVDSVRAIQSGFSTAPSASSFCNGASDLRPDGYCYMTQGQFLNVGSIRNQGWEMQGSINTGPFTTRGTYSWVKSRVIGITPRYRALLTGDGFIPGQTFSFIPEHTWAMNISYSKNRTFVLLNVNGLGQSIRQASRGNLDQVTSNDLRLRSQEAYRMGLLSTLRLSISGYTTANMTATQRFSSNLEATLQITNLTNYYRNDLDARYPTLGRLSRLGFRWRL